MKEAQKTDDGPKFDTRVTYYDNMGRVIKQDPYVLRVVAGPAGGKVQLFERPVGSGNIFDGLGRPFGRWVDGKHEEKLAHVAWTPPETEDQKLAKSLVEQKNKIEQLEKELTAIRAEREGAKKEGQKTK